MIGHGQNLSLITADQIKQGITNIESLSKELLDKCGSEIDNDLMFSLAGQQQLFTAANPTGRDAISEQDSNDEASTKQNLSIVELRKAIEKQKQKIRANLDA